MIDEPKSSLLVFAILNGMVNPTVWRGSDRHVHYTVDAQHCRRHITVHMCFVVFFSFFPFSSPDRNYFNVILPTGLGMVIEKKKKKYNTQHATCIVLR